MTRLRGVPMSETLGGRLRKQREQRNISLSAIAEETKIGLPLLEALERDDVSRWPAGIFRRAFVRSYAKAVGLDADAVLQEFQNVHPEPLESPSAGEWPSAPDPIAEESRGL